MIFRTWKKQKKKGICLAVGVLVGVLAVAEPFAEPLPEILAAQHADDLLPTGGLIECTIEQAEYVPSDHAGGTRTLFSIRPELRQFDWDRYSNDYYFSKLTAKEQLLYERLDAACGKLLTSSDEKASQYKVTVEQANGTRTSVTRRGTEMVSCLGLDTAQVQKVQTIFVYANPQYYFLNTTLLSSGTGQSCALGVYNLFEDGKKRAQETQKILARMEQLQDRIIDNGCVYETEAQIHELICSELTYKDDQRVLIDPADPYYTQSIYGALTTGETVCAGYTKLYAMLCNYFGIDCISVTSSVHAWNQVRYGDHWYHVDVTWDDESWDRGRYFHVSDAALEAMDQEFSHVPYDFYGAIRPAADKEFSGDLMLVQGLEQPLVDIQDTAAGARITMKASEGSVYYTLDGTSPGADDLYTGAIELTDGGTYVVTAMAAADGKLPSAYEIFPVRIAGGKVTVASASNVSGRKIKVTYKSAKTYTGYEVSYASKKDFSNQKSSKVKSKAVTISGLKKGKTYYIRVRGYKKDAYGNYYYTPYSAMKKVTVTK